MFTPQTPPLGNLPHNTNVEPSPNNKDVDSQSIDSSSSEENLTAIPTTREKKASVHAIKLRHILMEGRASMQLSSSSQDVDSMDFDPNEAGDSPSGLNSMKIFPFTDSPVHDVAHHTAHNITQGAVNEEFGHTVTEKELLDEKVKALEKRIKIRDEKKEKHDMTLKRRSTMKEDPEAMAIALAAHRRSVFLQDGESEASMPVAVVGPVRLKTKKAHETLFRSMPKLDRPMDERAYLAACEQVYELIVIQSPPDEGWFCQKRIGQVSDQ